MFSKKSGHKKIRKYSENHDFEIRIQEAVYKAKDVLKSGSSDLTDHVMEEFDSIYQENLELQHSHHAATVAAMSKFLSEYGLLPCSRGDQDFMFGFDGRIDLLAYGLIYKDRDEAEAEVEVRIFVGRAGIGKTSFARQVYGHEKIADHFDIRDWTSGFPLQFLAIFLPVSSNSDEKHSSFDPNAL